LFERAGTTGIFVRVAHESIMSYRKVVVFEASDIDAEERLIREYIVPAFRRLDDRDEVRWLIFNRYGADPSVDGGEVTFYIFGDVEAVASEERPRWDGLVENGIADTWWTDDSDVSINEFDEAELLHHRIRAAASSMSVEFFEAFEQLPAAIDAAESDDRYPVGAWMCIHYLINQFGYQQDQGEEEIDMLVQTIRNRLRVMAGSVGTHRAEAKINELVGELESLPAELREAVGEGSEHEHRYADREAFEEE
jgi:hypothetical protein